MANFDPASPPDPTYLFRLQNKVQDGSNVLAFQKTVVGSGVSGGGKWGFDVFYEKMDGSAWDRESYSCLMRLGERSVS